jgi:uncharacterized protein YlzI (FlbEa/FlbD family)
MAEEEQKEDTLFSKLKRLFSTDVIVRNVGGKKLKIVDTDEVQYATDRNSLRDRYNRLRSSTYNLHNRDMSLSYQSARLELFRDYDCVGEDTVIPLPDGSRPTIKELTEKYKNNPEKRFYVFSYDHETDSIKLGKAYHPRKKGQRKGYKVTFDDGSHVVGSLKHPFLMRNGEYKRIFELRVGDSVMPFYQNEYGYKNHGFKRYRRVYNFSKGWQPEHRVVAEQFERSMKKREVVHHKNFNGSDNSPENLIIMDAAAHRKFHIDHNKNVLWGADNYETQLNKLKSHPNYINKKIHKWNGERTGKNNPFFGKRHAEESNEKRSSSLKKVFKDRDQSDVKNPKYRHDITFSNVKEKAFELYKEYSKINLHDFLEHIKCDRTTLNSRLEKNNYSWKELKNEVETTLNHKVVDIEYVGMVDVYDVTVEKYENFATDSCFVSNTMDMDPILGSALDIYADECLSAETIIPLLDGRKTTIKDLYDKKEKDFWVYSVDRNGNFIPQKCERVAHNGKKKMVKLTLCDGTEVKCTQNHIWVLENGEQVKTSDLIDGLSLKGDQSNHRVIDIEDCGELDAYDLVNVGETHVYAIEAKDGSKVFTHNCLVPNEFGRILSIRSSNDDIKQILENLFYDILNVEFNLWSWTRNLCKYGDFFLKLELSPEYGVYVARPLSAYEVTRVEGSDPTNINYVKFQHDGLGGGSSYESFEIAHFRLISDSNFMPYGKSMIESARRVWKQLSLMEDAMLIHRIMRAPEKRMFYIDVGNIPPNEIDAYVQKMINNTKKTPYIDEKTGDYNLRFNLNNMVEDFYLPVRGSDSGTRIETLPGMDFTGIDDLEYVRNKMMAALKIPKAFLGYDESLCISPETRIPLLNGKVKTVKELIDDHNNGIKNYTYSIDESTHNIVPGEIMWAGYTRMNAEVVRVHLDNGEHIDCTPDHLFMTRDGKWTEAKNLKELDSLMPLYTEESTLENDKIKGYTKVYNPGSGEYVLLHKLVSEYYGTRLKGKVCHHADFDKLNNYPENLDFSMNFTEHRKFHSELTSETINSPENIKKRTSDPKWRQGIVLAGRKGGLKSGKRLGEWIKKHGPSNKGKKVGSDKNCTVCNNLFYTVKSADKTTCSQRCAEKYFEKYNTKYKLSKELLLEAALVSKSFKELEENLGSVDRNTLNRIFKYNNVSDKYSFVVDHMPLAKNNTGFMNNFVSKKNHKVARVEFLSEKIDTCDLQILNHHNFATAAGVIIHNSGKATLAAEDVRFSRTIGRLQRIIVSELTKIAIVHLYIQGYQDASLVDFELELNNPSTIFEQEKLAIWQDKLNVAKDMMDTKLFSKNWIYHNIWDMTENEVKSVEDEVVEDQKQTWRLEQINTEGEDPASKFASSGEESSTEDDAVADGEEEGTELPSLEEILEKSIDDDTILDEKKERDQTGNKEKYSTTWVKTRGEDPLGRLENRAKTTSNPIKHKFKGGSPLSMDESLKKMAETLNKRTSKKTIISEVEETLKESDMIEEDMNGNY